MTMDISSPLQFTISNNLSKPGQRVDPPGLHHLWSSSAEVWSSQGAYVQVVRRMMIDDGAADNHHDGNLCRSPKVQLNIDLRAKSESIVVCRTHSDGS